MRTYTTAEIMAMPTEEYIEYCNQMYLARSKTADKREAAEREAAAKEAEKEAEKAKAKATIEAVTPECPYCGNKDYEQIDVFWPETRIRDLTVETRHNSNELFVCGGDCFDNVELRCNFEDKEAGAWLSLHPALRDCLSCKKCKRKFDYPIGWGPWQPKSGDLDPIEPMKGLPAKTPSIWMLQAAEQLLAAVELVISVQDADPSTWTPGYGCKLEPKHIQQLRDAVNAAQSPPVEETKS